MPLWKRFVASTLDKIAILIFFALAMFFIQYTPYTAAGRIGRFVGMMSIPPSHYENIDMVSIDRGSATKNTSDYFQKREAYDLSREGIQTCKELDLTITIWFIFINVLYYLIGELIVGASFCKALLGGRLFDYKGNRITALHILLRNILFCLILIIFVALRFGLNISYFITIILFFLLYDSSLFKSKQNLLDIITKCYLRNGLCQENKHITIGIVESEPETIGSNLDVNHNNKHMNEHIINGRQDRKKISSWPLKRNKIMCLIYIVLSIYSIHNILSYFFADYYNMSNYNFAHNTYNEKESDNYLRKEYEKKERVWNEFPKEQFAISRQLPHSNSQGYWGNPQYGPIPDGELISTYEGEGTDTYIAGYKNVKYFRWENVLPRNMDETYEWMRTGEYKKKKVYYTVPEPYYKKYSYRNSISTFSLGGLSYIFANCEWWYLKRLNDIATQLNADKISFTYIEMDGKTAISYYSKDRSIKRVIIYANGNAYLLETESTENLSEQSGLLCSSVSLNHFQMTGGMRKIVNTYCVLFLCVAIAIVYFSRRKRKGEVYNRYAYSLFYAGISSIVLNFTIAICQSYMLFTNIAASCSSICILASALVTASFITTPLCMFYFQKSREMMSYDYIVPSLFRKLHYGSINSERKKKFYISFICYPFMVLSLLPFGIYVVLLYCVPMLIICSIIIWFNKWHHWVKESTSSETVSTNNPL